MKDSIDITVILDRSGSMEAVKADTIGGFNSFLAEQRRVRGAGDAVISLVQFDDQYETVYRAADIAAAPMLDDSTFRPRGSTALFDALGRTIDRVGRRLARIPEAERPSKVVIVTITDGFENASRRFTAAQVAAKVRHQSGKYSWEFVFIGANQDAILAAGELGIEPQRALTFAANEQGTEAVFSRMALKLSALRVSGQAAALDFTESDRAEQRRAGAV